MLSLVEISMSLNKINENRHFLQLLYPTGECIDVSDCKNNKMLIDKIRIGYDYG